MVSQMDSTSHCQLPIFTLLKGFIQGNCSWSLCSSYQDWLALTHVVFLLLSFSSADLPPHLEKIKQQANDAFARQQWTQAIQLYSLGIHRASCNAMLYGNRAAAYMKRKWYVPVCAKMIYPEAMKSVITCVFTSMILRDGDHYDALRDCLKALTLNPGHLKAHFRLARCLFELKYLAEALECLEDFKGKFPEQANSSACSALDKDIKAALFSKTESGIKLEVSV